MSDPVLEQYEAYPYPARSPSEERKRLITGSPSNLPEVSHYVFAGRPDFGVDFRVLVAGGGTGDAAIMMAQQLADQAASGNRGEVVYLDPSRAARRVAEARARERGLDNISFHTGSLLDLPRLGHGHFDYIDCCGVLHHLEDPMAGLAALTEVLAQDGGMGLMLYAPYGRSGVYPAQAMLRTLAAGLPSAERIALARRLLHALPPTNWLKLNPFIGDHHRSEAELFDLLLHARDRAYSVPEVVELVENAGLRLVTFIEPARYDPATYLKDPSLLKRLQGLDHRARAAFAENLTGNIKKHVFYVVRATNAADTVARADSPASVPVTREVDGPTLARAVAPDFTMRFDLDGLPLRVPMPRLASAILSHVDGRASLGEIHAALQELDGGLDWARFKARFDRLYKALNGLNHLLIRCPSAKP
jgi:SAM-dependent methyltransferase